MATQTISPMRGLLFINWKKWGWTETFNFPEMTVAAVRAHMTAIAALRAFLLPSQAVIQYGRIMMPGHPRQTVLAIAGPIAGNSAGLTTPPNNFLDSPDTTLLFRADGEAFSKAFIHIKALPDDAIQDMTLQFTAPGGTWVSSYHGAPPAVAAAATWAAGLKLLLSYYANACQVVRKGTIDLGGGTLGPGYNCYEINEIQFREVKNVKVGRPFDSPVARRTRR